MKRFQFVSYASTTVYQKSVFPDGIGIRNLLPSETVNATYRQLQGPDSEHHFPTVLILDFKLSKAPVNILQFKTSLHPTERKYTSSIILLYRKKKNIVYVRLCRTYINLFYLIDWFIDCIYCFTPRWKMFVHFCDVIIVVKGCNFFFYAAYGLYEWKYFCCVSIFVVSPLKSYCRTSNE